MAGKQLDQAIVSVGLPHLKKIDTFWPGLSIGTLP